jgi:hypothetical protein
LLLPGLSDGLLVAHYSGGLTEMCDPPTGSGADHPAMPERITERGGPSVIGLTRARDRALTVAWKPVDTTDRGA